MNNSHIAEHTIAILICKQISSNPCKKEITNKLFPYKSYVYPFKCVQKNDWCLIVPVISQYLKPFNTVKKSSIVAFKNVIKKMGLQIIYIYIYSIWQKIIYNGWYVIKPNPTKPSVSLSTNNDYSDDEDDDNSLI